ncbi:unnamed protein product, partial [Ascophyllum nodosum]
MMSWRLSLVVLPFVLILLHFVFMLSSSLKPRPLKVCSIVLRHAGVPIATRVSFSFFLFFLFYLSFFPFVYLACRFFPSKYFFCTIFAFSLYGEYVVRSFFPNGVFLPCDHGL